METDRYGLLNEYLIWSHMTLGFSGAIPCVEDRRKARLFKLKPIDRSPNQRTSAPRATVSEGNHRRMIRSS